jgi:hypothetical protein
VGLLGLVEREGGGKFGEVFAGVVEVDDVDGAGEMGGGDGFVVTGTVGEDDDLLGVVTAAAKGFLVDAQAEERA